MYICQVCKKEPATIHLTDIHNNIKKEVHLCENCAKEKGFNIQTAANLPQLLGLAAKKKMESPRQPRPVEEDLVCPTCGYKWSDFKNKGRLGCPNDYQAFGLKMHNLVASQLTPPSSPEDTFHVGKVPSGQTPVVDPVLAARRDLERRLRIAVAGERYEEAAGLKAELDKMLAGEPITE